jgi:adenine/guanine phosphoribosyltransferase-like PRPP-binding protein
MLAANIASLCGLGFAALIERTRDTAPQYRLSADERGKNVEGAFSLSGEGGYGGKRILLVDDIFTTGSTMAGCARLLSEKSGGHTFCFRARIHREAMRKQADVNDFRRESPHGGMRRATYCKSGRHILLSRNQ